MDRRDTLKTLLVGAVAGVTVGSAASCHPDKAANAVTVGAGEKFYGRTPKELERDNRIRSQKYLTNHELETIAVLCDIILPSTASATSATGAGVPAFIKFIVKDIPSHQLPMRGGLAWLDLESNKRFNKQFQFCTKARQIAIIDDIAYPDENNEKPDMAPGRKFFNLMRNLTVTGYYTSREGFKDLGYVGNRPNIWDGIPEEVLAEHDVDYDPEWIAKCVDQSKRDVIAKWDDDMNLIS
ncbi:gluconate 2-dehydrogenase subunit 3 family protein [Portibacter marinus]|uniref:gluconate 2-dehydrogenase subunit 3 family protein n=1 Tax=Portibacter marinus TaxID=2898660 RepID=UPI001F469ED7|nr:gluconate 2-dehydrogenase subunit 3 family protein [Portibacter marinus]